MKEIKDRWLIIIANVNAACPYIHWVSKPVAYEAGCRHPIRWNAKLDKSVPSCDEYQCPCRAINPRLEKDGIAVTLKEIEEDIY